MSKADTRKTCDTLRDVGPGRCLGLTAAVLAVQLFWPVRVGAQAFETLGTRAAGMGGAFVAVADDASAVYWNPAGFASGSYLSLVMDRAAAKVAPTAHPGAGSRSGWLLALGMPALGLSYYRLESTTLTDLPAGVPSAGRNAAGAASVRVDRLVTHSTGATLVQSIVEGLAVGATVKLVRGIASSAVHPDGNRDALLDDASTLGGRARNTFDADLGVMATFGRLKAGVTVRNITEPAFEVTGDGGPLKLERQARAGVAVMPRSGWLAAADLDLVRTTGPLGDVRDLALGTEGRVAKRAFVRGGVRVNTAATGAGGRTPSLSVGGSYAVTASLLVDAQLTTGSDRTGRGVGVAGRFVY